MPQAVKVRADIEVGCCAYEGIDAVKNALRACIACSEEDMPIKINLIAPPLYVVTTTTMDREKGLELLTTALQKIEASIKNSGGIFTTQVAVIIFELNSNKLIWPMSFQCNSNVIALFQPKVVTDLDEAELAKKMEQLDRENQEVSGDDDEEEDDDNVETNDEPNQAQEVEPVK